MRLWTLMGCLLLAVLLSGACSDDEGAMDDAGTESDGAADEDDGAVANDAGPDSEDAGFDANFADASSGFPPRIERLSVHHAPDSECTAGTLTDVEVTVDAMDPDTPQEDLSYSGMFEDCTGEIDAPFVTIECNESSGMGGPVTVTDPDGLSDTLEIGFDACMNRSVP